MDSYTRPREGGYPYRPPDANRRGTNGRSHENFRNADRGDPRDDRGPSSNSFAGNMDFHRTYNTGDRNGLTPVYQLNKIPRKETAAKPAVEEEFSNAEILNLKKEEIGHQLKVESLAKLFDRTQAQNNELTRTKHKRGVTDHDPELLDNYKLLNDVKVKLEKERRALEEVKEKIARHEERFKQQNVPDNESGEVPMAGPARAYQSTDFVTAPEPEEEEPNSKMIYIDPGNHWCEKCDIFFHKISDYLDHLQTEDHWRKMSGQQDQPWRPKPRPKLDIEDATIAQFKGAQFITPIKGFYCSICLAYFGDDVHAAEHIKGSKHNRAYMRFTLVSPQYEHIYTQDKSKAIVRVQKEEKKRLREEQEREIREREAVKQKREDEIRKKERELKEKLAEEARNARRLREMNEESSGKKLKLYALGDKNRHSKYDRKERRDTVRSRSSTPDTSRSSSIRKGKDPKLDMKVEVVISKDEFRRAYTVFMDSITEAEREQLTRPTAAPQGKIEKKPEPTEEELRIAKARAVLDNVSFDDDVSNDAFNLASVIKSEPGIDNSDEQNENSRSKLDEDGIDDPEIQNIYNALSMADSTPMKTLTKEDGVTSSELDSIPMLDRISSVDDLLAKSLEAVTSTTALDAPVIPMDTSDAQNESVQSDQDILDDIFSGTLPVSDFAEPQFPTLGLDDLTKTPPYN